MTDENIIAIVAIIISGIVSVVTLVATIYTTRMNHKAELRKMAFEKRIDSFSYIVEIITDMEHKRETLVEIAKILKETYTLEGIHEELLQDLHIQLLDFYNRRRDLINGWKKHSIYIPPHIYKEIYKYMNLYATNIKPVDATTVMHIISESLDNPVKTKIVGAMRKEIGLE